jgi:hypothetical protein
MRCSANAVNAWLAKWLALVAVLGACGLLLAGPAAAAEPEVREAQLSLTDDGYAVSAEFSFELRQRLEEAVTRGVPLSFAVDFELTRPRWYWLDEKIASHSLTMQLSYHALTRQYRLSSGTLHQNFRTLDEAVAILSRLRPWTVFERNAVKVGESYQAAIRLRLDISQLPKPFQVTALANREWALSTDWRRWTFVPMLERDGGGAAR